MPDSFAVLFGGGKEFTSTGHEGKETLISTGALKGNRISKNELDWTLFTKWGFMMQFQLVLVCVCVRSGREGECVSAAISQDNSLLESMFVIAVKVWCTLILVLP